MLQAALAASAAAPHAARHSEVIVALQGTLDTFALPDVLRLLATTRKTGRLLVHGNRGDGSVWVDAGAVVAAEAAGVAAGSSAADVIFELLRHTEGAFTFEAGSSPSQAGAPADVEPLLIGAEGQLSEWREIEAVVPSLDAWVTLAPELPTAEATIDAARWRTIVAIGGGTAVRSIGDALGLGEVEISRLVKELVELGLGSVVSVGPGLLPDSRFGADAVDLGPFADRKVTPLNLSIDLGPFADEPAAPEADQAEPVVPATNGFAIDIPGVAPIGASATDALPPPPPPRPHAAPVNAPEPLEADEVARQLAALSPKAARAVAVAAKAETIEEREAALAEVIGDDDEPINRGLLLKFLSSVRS
jgi:hypothetical protein